MEKNIKEYIFIGISIVLFIILIFVINYSLDLNKDYKKIENQFIKEKQNYVFLGDSITYGYPLDEFYDKYYVVNSGINGNKTTDILKNLDERLYRYNPTKVFLLIGINDMAAQEKNKTILKNIENIIVKIQKKRPYTKIYVESVYPLGKKPDSKSMQKVKNDKIIELNKGIKKICNKHNLTYINVHDGLVDEDGYMKKKYSEDGVHPNGLGYYKVTTILKKYVKEKI